MEYRQISRGTKWIYVGNNTRVKTKRIGTCKLELRDGQILYLHDVPYTLDIQRNLISIIVLLMMEYHLQFYGVNLKIIFNSTLVATSYLLNGFIIFYINYYDSNNTWHAKLGHIG